MSKTFQTPRKPCKQFLPPIVTDDEIQAVEREKTSLLFEIHTAEVRRSRKWQKELKELFPECGKEEKQEAPSEEYPDFYKELKMALYKKRSNFPEEWIRPSII